MPVEINADYVIRRTILFDNKCGFVLGENPKAPNSLFKEGSDFKGN